MSKETVELKKQELLKELPSMVTLMDNARSGADRELPVDITLSEMVEEKWGIPQEEFLEKLDIDTKVDTLHNLFTMPDQSVRWVVPEIIRSAVNLGLRDAPIYKDLIASDQPVNGLKVTMPYINMSSAAPEKVNEAETIPLGNISYGSKDVSIFKIGKGIKITDEVKNYVSLDVLGIFLRDFGIQLGYAMDTLALDVLINGNKADGSEAAPVIGCASGTAIVYRDLLKIWIRGSRMGRKFTTMVGDEDQALDILDLAEFKTRQQGTTTATLNVKTPVPNSADFYIHPGTPTSQLLMVDKASAMIKLTAQNLLLESERIVSNQTSAVYASLTTGFSKMYQDASLLLASNLTFADNGFPAYMNPDPYLNITL